MLSETALLVTPLSATLMEATPARPVEHGVWWRQDPDDEAVDQPTHLGNGEGDQVTELSHGGPPWGAAAAAPGRRDPTTARWAHARKARGRRRHHRGQRRAPNGGWRTPHRARATLS